MVRHFLTGETLPGFTNPNSHAKPRPLYEGAFEISALWVTNKKDWFM